MKDTISNEYLMLRSEILHLGTLENQTMNFLYVFVATVIAFSIAQNDTIIILLSYIVIIPSYKLVISHEKGIYKIGAYLYVFLEGNEFNWERRNFAFYNELKAGLNQKTYFQAFNYPFLFVSSFVMLIFLLHTNFIELCQSSYELFKLTVAFILYFYVWKEAIRNRYYSISKYIDKWQNIKITYKDT